MNSLVETAMFVTNETFLADGGGGVQWCTREYLDTIRKVYETVETVSFPISRRATARVRRTLIPAPFRDFHDPGLTERLISRAMEINAKWVLLNNMDAAVLAPRLRAASADLRIVYLSHGAELTDVVNDLRLGTKKERGAPSNSWIGALIRLELDIRRSLDAVICISDEDRIFEHWLGSKRTLFLPRQVPCELVDRRPIKGRVGTVSTLDHGPNVDGIKQLAPVLDKIDGITLRVVGGPVAIGQELASQFRCVEYLGRLDDQELEREAATWCAFVNPIFCQARGASTKVATALGWRLPVLTTPQGARGYYWDPDALPLASSPQALAAECERFAALPADSLEAAQRVARMAPTVAEAAGMIHGFLKQAAS